MEFHGKFSMELHGILSGFGTWNSMEFHGGFWNSMEFHESSFSMEFHSVWVWDMEFHGIPWRILEFHEGPFFHGIPWNSMKVFFHGIPLNFMEFFHVLKNLKKITVSME